MKAIIDAAKTFWFALLCEIGFYEVCTGCSECDALAWPDDPFALDASR